MAGSIRGRRRWEVGPSGYLAALGNGYLYRPLKPTEEAYRAEHWGAYPVREEEYRSGRHAVAGAQCTCGFYAYFDVDDDEYANMASTVMGIFDGFGRATVGPLGFRVERGHIKAFVNPFSLRSTIGRIRKFEPARAVFFATLIPLAMSLIPLIAGLWVIGLGFIAAFTIINFLNLFACLITEGIGYPNELPKSRWKEMLNHYPYVPVYKSLALAAKDFPLTKPEVSQ